MKQRSIIPVFLAIITTALFAMNLARADSTGRAVEFLIEEKGASLPQIALVQNGKIFIRQIGGDPYQDFLFNASSQTLFLINHQNKSYYKIDQNVINKGIMCRIYFFCARVETIWYYSHLGWYWEPYCSETCLPV